MFCPIYKHLIIFFHNLLLIPFLFIFYDLMTFDFYFFMYFSLSLVLILLFIFSFGLILAIMSARFRDIESILQNLMRIMFFASPIIWSPKIINNEYYLDIIRFNPFFHFIEFIRNPLLGINVDFSCLFYLVILISFFLIISFYLYGKYSRRVPHWI